MYLVLALYAYKLSHQCPAKYRLALFQIGTWSESTGLAMKKTKEEDPKISTSNNTYIVTTIRVRRTYSVVKWRVRGVYFLTITLHLVRNDAFRPVSHLWQDRQHPLVARHM